MRRAHASVIAAVFVLGVVAACSDVPSGPQAGSTEVVAARADHRSGSCLSMGELEGLARQVFGKRGPNVNSVLGKLESLEKDLKRGKTAKAIEAAHRIVEFTLDHHRAGNLPGTTAQLTAFVNGVYCFVGLDLRINEPSNSHLIFPADQPQIVRSVDLQAGLSLQANPVTEPTLIEFQQLPDTFSLPGGGPLGTKLDQYPGYLSIVKSSQTNAPLAQPVVVGVCASGVIPQDVRDRLRLGHQKTSGFEVAPAADAGFLVCENAVEVIGSAGVLSRIAGFLSPKPLQASAAHLFVGGGVGGTVTEFSRFAPVDPALRSGGGVGGTVTEFTRSSLNDLFAGPVSPVESCSPITALEGHQVSAACRPFVRIATRLGTVLEGVPVMWGVTAGSGTVADETLAECGAFASTIVAPTDLFGRSAICWTLGAAGPQQVQATPSAGGDAPAGVTFEPATVTFNAVATPAIGVPAVIILLQGDGETAIAGQLTRIPPKIRVEDAYGNPVGGVTVDWTTVIGTGHPKRPTSVTDLLGKTITDWTVGLGANRLRISFSLDGVLVAAIHIDATGIPAP